MKKIFLSVLIVFSLSTKAQITLEQVYDTASTMSGSGFLPNQLMIVNFEVSGQHYVKINRDQDQIQIYSMSHSLVKTISYATFPQTCNAVPTILYLTEQLFDTDPAIEFMYIANTCAGVATTYIYKEDGTLLFSEVATPTVMVNVEQVQYPIYNTNQGAKMILSYPNGQAKVFGLQGTLSCYSPCNNSLITGISTSSSGTKANSLSNPYPNPTLNSTTIDYNLPKDSKEGEIIFFDVQGKEIKRFKVDRTFTSLVMSTADIPAGTYYYQLQTIGNTSEAKKLVVIK